jgi:hypothetical protein
MQATRQLQNQNSSPKKIVFDTSTIISLVSTCFTDVFLHLSKHFDLYLPKEVEKESIEKPGEIRGYSLNAYRIKNIIKRFDFIIEPLTPQDSQFSASLLLNANRLFTIENRYLNILQKGESDVVALAKRMDALVATDERVVRNLIEEPQNLKKLLEDRNKAKVELHQGNFFNLQEKLKGIRIVRSVDLFSRAFKENDLCYGCEYTEKFLESSLFALKNAGCSVSTEEIVGFVQTMKNAGKI